MNKEKQLTILLLKEKLQKLTNKKVILEDEDIDFGIFKPKSSFEDKQKKYEQIVNKKIQDYIKNGSVGDLELYNTPITSLPDNLTKVGGDLDLSCSQITSLPDNLTVKGNLFGGNLNLSHTKITSLPNNLTVGGGLYLNNTPITELPDNLTVGGGLYLSSTPITELPDNLTVGGDLWLNTPMSRKYTKEQIKQMYPNIKGDIIM